MTSKNSQHRVIYLDLLRLFAIIMMLQGHTIQVLLADECRDMESFIYSTWYFLRGFTAPVFMFTAGVVFTYLISRNEFSLTSNPRIIKGIGRGLSLILIGYLLRYPTFNVFGFSDVTKEQWLIFFSVDALHLIGFGILLIILIEWISSLLKISNIFLFSIGAFIIFIISPVVNSIEWNKFLSIPFAAYFTFERGSIFPLFPFLQYVFIGAIIGSLIRKYPNLYRKKTSIILVSLAGLLLVAGSQMIFFITSDDTINYYSQSLVRIGAVLILNSMFALISIWLVSFPKPLMSLAKNSLVIYIIHIVILYGSPWSLGLYHLIGKSFSIFLTILSTLIMITLMTLISLRIDKFRMQKRKEVY